MYFITTKRMLEVCFSAHPNIQYRTPFWYSSAAYHFIRKLDIFLLFVYTFVFIVWFS